MEFPVTVDSQEAFDDMVKSRLDREKTKQAELQTQVDTLTAEKQDLTTKAADFETRATTAEQWKADRESKDQLTDLAKSVAKTAKLPDGAWKALKGSSKEELTAHAEELKPLLTPPSAPVIQSIGDSPQNAGNTEALQAVHDLFGTD